MIIQFLKKSDNGLTEFSLQLNNTELNFLINFAMGALLNMGAVTADPDSDLPQEITLPVQTVGDENPFIPAAAEAVKS